MSEKVLDKCDHDLPDPLKCDGEVWRCGLCGYYFRPYQMLNHSQTRWYVQDAEKVERALRLRKEVRGE